MERIFTRDPDLRRTALKPFALALMLVAVIMAAAYPGTGLFSQGYALVLIAVTMLTVVVFSKAVLSILLTSIPMLLIWVYTGGSFVYAALICSPVIVIGVGAFLLRTLRSPFLIGVVPAAYLVALLVGGRPVAALWSLIFFPAAYILASGFSGKTPRVTLLCRTTVALAITGAVAGIVYLIVMKGSFSLDLLKETVDDIFVKLNSYFTNQYALLSEKYAEFGIDASMLSMSADDAELYAVSIFNIIPALAVMILGAVSFIAYQITISFFLRSGQKRYLTPATISFNMSKVSAIVFILAYLVMFICAFTEASNISIITENLYLILMPGLALTGILVAFGKGEDGRRHTFRLVLILVLLLILPSLALAFAAFMGCGSVLSVRRPNN